MMQPSTAPLRPDYLNVSRGIFQLNRSLPSHRQIDPINRAQTTLTRTKSCVILISYFFALVTLPSSPSTPKVVFQGTETIPRKRGSRNDC